MDVGTISFLCSIILCLVGVATFVSGKTSRYKAEGVLEQKVQQTLDGITDVKKKLDNISSAQNTMGVTIASHSEQIVTLFNQQTALSSRIEAVDKSSDTLKAILSIFTKE